MMLATILLIVNACFTFFKDKALFSFWHFFWIYPAEILFWIFIIFGISKIYDIF